MRAVLSLSLLLVMCTASPAPGVQVKDGDRSFPLQAVETLKDLMDVDSPVNPRLAWTGVAMVCQDPNLPQVFQPVCREREAALTFSRLASPGLSQTDWTLAGGAAHQSHHGPQDKPAITTLRRETVMAAWRHISRVLEGPS
ncbi:Guanylin [Merluccius polli]|uniref:Guanylate cyclase activator 2B n=1 Tax=Merluccius polli TaxID=89951 RepID=A0AA47NZH9_MERPO|nr:Guanylin [Merluccius polli]